MNWTKNVNDLERVFDYCFSFDSRIGDNEVRNSIKEAFVRILQDGSLSNKHKIAKACWLFDNSKGSYSRESFFEICFNESLLDDELLTGLYLSVHVHARPYEFFSEDKMREIFQRLNRPIKCFCVKDELDNLEDTAKIYRGLRTQPEDLEKCGYCWTLNKAVASRFATGDCQTSGFIVSGLIMKADIIGLVLVRNEEEIIALPEHVLNKVIDSVRC